MKSSAISIISDALIQIGEYQEADIIHDDDAERGLKTLNDMVDMWSTQNLACYAFLTQSVVLVNNKAEYTVGPITEDFPTPDIIGVRPRRLEQVYLTIPGTSRVRLPVVVNTLFDFNMLVAPEATSTLPTNVYYDPQDPIGIIKVWPIPASPTNTMYWTSYQQLTEFPNLADEIDFPIGYKSALKNNLAVELCPYFGKAVPPDLRQKVNDAKGWMKRQNIIPQTAYFDTTLTTNYRSGNFNIWTGTFGGVRT